MKPYCEIVSVQFKKSFLGCPKLHLLFNNCDPQWLQMAVLVQILNCTVCEQALFSAAGSLTTRDMFAFFCT